MNSASCSFGFQYDLMHFPRIAEQVGDHYFKSYTFYSRSIEYSKKGELQKFWLRFAIGDTQVECTLKLRGT